MTLDHDVVARDAHEMTALRCEEADTIGMITLHNDFPAYGAIGVFGDVHAPALVIQIFLQLRDGVLRVFEFAFSVSVSAGELGGFLLAEIFQVLTTPGLGACRAIGIQLHEVGRDSATTRDDLRAIGAHHVRYWWRLAELAVASLPYLSLIILKYSYFSLKYSYFSLKYSYFSLKTD